MLLSKATHIAYKVYVLSVPAFLSLTYQTHAQLNSTLSLSLFLQHFKKEPYKSNHIWNQNSTKSHIIYNTLLQAKENKWVFKSNEEV